MSLIIKAISYSSSLWVVALEDTHFCFVEVARWHVRDVNIIEESVVGHDDKSVVLHIEPNCLQFLFNLDL